MTTRQPVPAPEFPSGLEWLNTEMAGDIRLAAREAGNPGLLDLLLN